MRNEITRVLHIHVHMYMYMYMYVCPCYLLMRTCTVHVFSCFLLYFIKFFSFFGRHDTQKAIEGLQVSMQQLLGKFSMEHSSELAQQLQDHCILGNILTPPLDLCKFFALIFV